ncbi:phosphonate C-P lyase system protein PhnH [filamentous cyanobacterium CCP5]|nr:phosphonate C-P lyase system protein PhnH [filamentous cyanobacterium CCP5]
MSTLCPGLSNPVHDAQKTFRALLDALARPGTRQVLAPVQPPVGLAPACGAACLTLVDLETTVWIQPGLPAAIAQWLRFHQGCPITTDPQQADFALIADIASAPDLTAFRWGSAEYPEDSTTVLIQLPRLDGGVPVTLQGPGIQSTLQVELPLPEYFWSQWQEMTAAYPLGVDAWFFADNQGIGLPRTTQLSAYR